LAIYSGALDMLKDYPVFGTGIGAMPAALPLYVKMNIHSYIEHLHNDWLEITLGAGYLGAAVILCGIIWFMAVYWLNVKNLGRRKKVLYLGFLSVLFLMGAASLVDFHFFIPANAFIFFTVLGALCSPSFFKNKIKALNVNIISKVFVLLLCAAMLYIPVKKTIAWRYVSFGQKLLPQARLEYYTKAVENYASHRYAAQLSREYLKQSLRKDLDPQTRALYRARAHEIAKEYLMKYPAEKELSSLYTASHY
jgi:hypothetical protein